MQYLVIKALHIIFMVSWFAGLFYIIRLFIYHTEANDKPDMERNILQSQFKIMERKLWYIITWPAMVLTVTFGVWMLVLNPALLKSGYMHIKLGFVAGLIIYHLVCGNILRQLKQNIFKLTSFKLRLLNELATLFLVAIVFIIVLRHSMNWVWGLLGFFGTAFLLLIAVKTYKQIRGK